MAKLSISDVSKAFSKGPDPRDALKLETSFKGYKEFKKELQKFAPDIKRAMDKEVRNYLKPVVLDAQSMVPGSPLSGWRTGPGRGANNTGGALPNYDPETVRKGIKVRQGQKRGRRSGEAVVNAWEIRNEDGAGAAYEGAGRKGGRSEQGRRFIAALSLYHGKFPRLIWRAWGKAGGDKKITVDVMAIVKFHEAKFQHRMNSISPTKD